MAVNVSIFSQNAAVIQSKPIAVIQEISSAWI